MGSKDYALYSRIENIILHTKIHSDRPTQRFHVVGSKGYALYSRIENIIFITKIHSDRPTQRFHVVWARRYQYSCSRPYSGRNIDDVMRSDLCFAVSHAYCNTLSCHHACFFSCRQRHDWPG